MEFSDYLHVLRRNWLAIVTCAILGLFIGASLSFFSPRSYSASTKLFVAIQNSGSVSELQQGNTFTQARVKSYIETAKTPLVLEPAIDSLGLDLLPNELAGSIEASADLNTVILTITASNESPVLAAAIAQAVGDSLISAVETLESPTAGPSPVKLSVVTPATAPTSYSSPNTKVNIALGLVLGIILGVCTAIVRSALDTRIRGELDLQRISDAPLLGGISYDEDASKKPLLTQAPPQGPRAESFRQIRTNLQFANINSKSKSMLVTSSLPGEGKSTTAVNMAIAMAEAGRKVALIDADLRRPMIATYLGLEPNAGLTTALLGDTNVEDVMQPWGEDDLYVLTAGQIPPNPSELLGSNAMSELLRQLEAAFDIVIVDAPPLIPVTDGSVLAQQVGGVLLVVGASKTKNQDVEKSLASLRLVEANLLGVVLNLLPTKGPDAYAYSYESYQAPTGTAPKKRKSPRSSKIFAGSHLRVSKTSDNKTDSRSF